MFLLLSQQICISLALLLTEIRCGYDFHGLDGLHGAPLLDPAIFKSPIIQAPVIPAPTIVKAIAPAPAPIFHGAPVIKAIGPPATSYATVTQVHVTHPAPSFLKVRVNS